MRAGAAWRFRFALGDRLTLVSWRDIGAWLAGSSFGSMLGASFAARHPARVRRPVLLGASRGQKWLPADQRSRRLSCAATFNPRAS